MLLCERIDQLNRGQGADDRDDAGKVLTQKEEHGNDMHDLLVSREGRPMLEK